MLFRAIIRSNVLKPINYVGLLSKCHFSQMLEGKFSDLEKEKILQVINESDDTTLYRYDITKLRAKKIAQWKNNNGQLKNISDIEMIEGFSEKTTMKLFSSILNGPTQVLEITNKIRGQFLHPHLSESTIKNSKAVLAVYVAANSVCWTLIDKSNYEVLDWKCHNIDYPEGKRFQITDLMNVSWQITQELPVADIYVMKAEPTSLRAGGSDPNNPKVLTVNLQKSQMIAMIVALINARNNMILNEDSDESMESGSENTFKQKVYFLRATLPYRLYGTLVGNENVATDQTIHMLLQEMKGPSPNKSKVFISETFQSMYRSQNELQKDMLGHSLLLGLTFMDLCIYKNEESIGKLLKRNAK